ncbi:hypothetical protein [Aeoliella sp. SH292]|uniref:hypothetical protein n=1 Tax=Aeoliella sp. SH292 TaxID=3454464 RepID=UPI003F9CDD6C
MRTINTKVAIAGALMASFAITGVASAQCATCAVPQTVWSPVVTPAPVVVNNVTVDDRWYLGKNLGRWNRRVWGSAPAQAQVVGMPVVAAPATTWAVGYAPATTWSAAYAPASTYSVGYAPATTWSAGYAPACSTCGVSDCGCATTAFRPVIMQPAAECSTCNACNVAAPCSSCASGVVTTSYDAPVNTGCSTCAGGGSSVTSSYVQQAPTQAAPAPSLPTNAPAPPQTFRETDRLDPIPAEAAAPADQASDLSAPLLLDANGDKMTKRPTAPVWTAVYKHPAKITAVSAAGADEAKPAAKQTIGWTSGR